MIVPIYCYDIPLPVIIPFFIDLHSRVYASQKLILRQLFPFITSTVRSVDNTQVCFLAFLYYLDKICIHICRRICFVIVSGKLPYAMIYYALSLRGTNRAYCREPTIHPHPAVSNFLVIKAVRTSGIERTEVVAYILHHYNAL